MEPRAILHTIEVSEEELLDLYRAGINCGLVETPEDFLRSKKIPEQHWPRLAALLQADNLLMAASRSLKKAVGKGKRGS